MSHFYGSIPSSSRRTVPTACATKGGGLKVRAASWAGAIETHLYHQDGLDRFEVRMVQHQGAGDYKVIASGIVGAADSIHPGGE